MVFLASAQTTEEKVLTFFLNESQHQIKQSRPFKLRLGVHTIFPLALCWMCESEHGQREMQRVGLRWATPLGTSSFCLEHRLGFPSDLLCSC